MSEENKENMQQNEGVKIDIESPEAEIIENADRLQEAENQAEEADMGGVTPIVPTIFPPLWYGFITIPSSSV